MRKRFSNMKEYCQCIREYIEMYEEHGCTRAGNVRQQLSKALVEDRDSHLPSLKVLVVIETVMFSLWEFDEGLPAPDWSASATDPFKHQFFISTLQEVWPELFEG